MSRQPLCLITVQIFQIRRWVIPGFGLSLGVTLAMLGTLVLVPLASIFVSAARLSLTEFADIVTSRQVLSGSSMSL